MGCESPSQTSPPSGLENRLRKLTARHVCTHESTERAEGYSCLTGVGRDCSWHVQRLSGASINAEPPQRISRLCFCHHHTESSSMTPSNPTAKPDPQPQGVFPGVNYSGVCFPSRLQRENLYLRKKSQNAQFREGDEKLHLGV